jgi:hypothetical protein
MTQEKALVPHEYGKKVDSCLKEIDETLRENQKHPQLPEY